MKTSTTEWKMFLAAATLFIGGAYSQTVGPTVGIGSLQPVNAGSVFTTEDIVEAEMLVGALEEMDDAITVGRPVEVGELLCDTLEAAEDARYLTFVISPTETITAERLAFEIVPGEVFSSDGIGRKTWMGQVTNESEEEQRNGLPMTVSMTWGDKCDVETFLLKAKKKNGDGSINVIKTIPCNIGSNTDICLVETNIASSHEAEPVLLPGDVLPDDVVLASGDGVSYIWVLMLYSDTQKQALGAISNCQMETELVQALASSNLAMELSGIPLKFTPKGLGQTPDGQDLTLGELAADSDVAAWRDQKKADLVQAIVALPPDLCGQGRLFNNKKTSGFSVVRAICLDFEVHTHEFGHNLGCGHELGNEDERGWDEYSHGKNFCTDLQRFKTIMAYDCKANGILVPTPVENIFSSPDLEINGTPTGSSGEDNVRTIMKTRFAVATYL